MDDPHDDTDVPSGTTDGAPMEMTSPPVRQHRALSSDGSISSQQVYPDGIETEEAFGYDMWTARSFFDRGGADLSAPDKFK